MSAELRTIMVCQAPVCQDKGSKGVLHRLQTVYKDRFTSVYPKLQIVAGDCNGGCEEGPIVKVNDAVLLREVDNHAAQEILENPSVVLGEVIHVLEEDQEAFDRIASGELY